MYASLHNNLVEQTHLILFYQNQIRNLNITSTWIANEKDRQEEN